MQQSMSLAYEKLQLSSLASDRLAPVRSQFWNWTLCSFTPSRLMFRRSAPFRFIFC